MDPGRTVPKADAAGDKRGRNEDISHAGKSYAAPELKAYREYETDREIGHATPKHKADRESMLVSVKLNGHALRNAAPDHGCLEREQSICATETRKQATCVGRRQW